MSALVKPADAETGLSDVLKSEIEADCSWLQHTPFSTISELTPDVKIALHDAETGVISVIATVLISGISSFLSFLQPDIVIKNISEENYYI